jgi:translation initiation factor IF-2
LAKRFYQISLELGMAPRSLIGELAAVGLSVGNQMVIVPPALEERIRSLHGRLHPAETTDGEAAPSAPPVAVAEEPVEVAEVEAPEIAHPLPEAVAESTAAVEPLPTFVPGAPAETRPAAQAPSAPPPTPIRLAPPSGRLVAAKPRAPGELVPTIDPRAGRLLKEAPKAGVPGVTSPRGPAGGSRGQPGVPFQNLNPALPKAAPAPGARRDGGRRDRDTIPLKEGDGKHGKETFQLRSRRRHAAKTTEAVDLAPKSFEVTPPVSLKDFSEVSGIKVADVVKTLLIKHKQMVTPNSMLDEDTLTILALEFDRDIKFVKQVTSEDTMIAEAAAEAKPEDLITKPPVVVVMGHVDHGKTTLLDSIRKTDVAAHEAGGITQHIGAYQVTLADGKKVTFLDTPGHEAFTEMRRRGAAVTDVVVLVVAADDGVMPQTVEAIQHAKAAEVPIVVAMTKADKVGFAADRIDRVKQQLSANGVLLEGWGGETACFPVSGTTGQGVDKLLEHLVLLSEVEDLKANPNRTGVGTVVEAENNPGRGVLATLLVENGTLRKGDAILAGRAWGRIRAMRDDKGRPVEEAPPGMPVEVTGLDEVPDAGTKFYVREDSNELREIAESRRGRDRQLELAAQAKPKSLEGLFSAIEQGKVKSLRVVLKTDVKGSLEAIKAKLDKLGNAEVKIDVILSGVGAVTESDVTLAAASRALVVGFHVVADEQARVKAKHTGVDIRNYRIIYELEDDMRALLEGKLAPEQRETILGHAEVLQVIRSGKVGNIAGCRVRDGLIRRDAQVRLARQGIVVWEGRVDSLRRFKEDVREVKEGFECGIHLESFDDVKEGDVIEAFSVESVARTLAPS